MKTTIRSTAILELTQEEARVLYYIAAKIGHGCGGIQPHILPMPVDLITSDPSIPSIDKSPLRRFTHACYTQLAAFQEKP